MALSAADKLASDYRRVKDRIGRIDRTLQKVAGSGNVPIEIIREAEKEINDEHFMEDIIEARFDAERTRAVGGQPWRPLAASTIARKGNSRILYETGHLKGAAMEAVRGTFKYRPSLIKWDLSNVHTVDDYAKWHQHGTPKMYARPFFYQPTPAELAPALAEFRKKVKDKMRKMGLTGI